MDCLVLSIYEKKVYFLLFFVYLLFIVYLFIYLDYYGPLWAADVLNEPTCAVPSRPSFSPHSCGSFVSPKVRQLSVWLKWHILSAAWREWWRWWCLVGGEVNGIFPPLLYRMEDIFLHILDGEHHSILRLFSLAPLAAGDSSKKQHFLNSPKTPTPEVSSPPLSYLPTPSTPGPSLGV